MYTLYTLYTLYKLYILVHTVHTVQTVHTGTHCTQSTYTTGSKDLYTITVSSYWWWTHSTDLLQLVWILREMLLCSQNVSDDVGEHTYGVLVPAGHEVAEPSVVVEADLTGRNTCVGEDLVGGRRTGETGTQTQEKQWKDEGRQEKDKSEGGETGGEGRWERKKTKKKKMEDKREEIHNSVCLISYGSKLRNPRKDPSHHSCTLTFFDSCTFLTASRAR